MIPPPPPMSPDMVDDEALGSVLISWYMSGYHTGFYLVCTLNYSNQYIKCKGVFTFFKLILRLSYREQWVQMLMRMLFYFIRHFLLACLWTKRAFSLNSSSFKSGVFSVLLKGVISKHCFFFFFLFYRDWNRAAKKLPIGRSGTTNEMIKFKIFIVSVTHDLIRNSCHPPFCAWCVLLVAEMLMKCTRCERNVQGSNVYILCK